MYTSKNRTSHETKIILFLIQINGLPRYKKKIKIKNPTRRIKSNRKLNIIYNNIGGNNNNNNNGVTASNQAKKIENTFLPLFCAPRIQKKTDINQLKKKVKKSCNTKIEHKSCDFWLPFESNQTTHGSLEEGTKPPPRAGGDSSVNTRLTRKYLCFSCPYIVLFVCGNHLDHKLHDLDFFLTLWRWEGVRNTIIRWCRCHNLLRITMLFILYTVKKTVFGPVPIPLYTYKAIFKRW